MTTREIVVNEIKKLTGKDVVDGNMNIYKDLEISSLEAFELLANLETEIGFEIDEEVLGNVTTMDELVEAIDKLKED